MPRSTAAAGSTVRACCCARRSARVVVGCAHLSMLRSLFLTSVVRNAAITFHRVRITAAPPDTVSETGGRAAVPSQPARPSRGDLRAVVLDVDALLAHLVRDGLLVGDDVLV